MSTKKIFALFSVNLTLLLFFLCPFSVAEDSSEPLLTFDFTSFEKTCGKIRCNIDWNPSSIEIFDGLEGESVRFSGKLAQAVNMKSQDERFTPLRELTLSLWFKISGYPVLEKEERGKSYTLISKNWNWRLRVVRGGILEATFFGKEHKKDIGFLYSKEPLVINQWHHVAYQFSLDKQRMALYLDGKKQMEIKGNKVDFELRNEESFPLIIGSSPDDLNPFKGEIDEFAFYGDFLPEKEIIGLYKKHKDKIKTPNPELEDFKGKIKNQQKTLALIKKAGRYIPPSFKTKISEITGKANVLALLAPKMTLGSMQENKKKYNEIEEALISFENELYCHFLSQNDLALDASRIVCFIVDPFRKEPVLPNSFLEPLKIGSQIKLKGAPGEYLSASFVLRSIDKNIDLLEIEKEGLESVDVDVRTVKLWFQGHSAWDGMKLYTDEGKVYVPELLLHNEKLIKVDREKKENFLLLDFNGKERYTKISGKNVAKISGEIADRARVDYPVKNFPVKDDSESFQGVKLEKNKNKQFWLTIRLPEDSVPGLFSGEVFVKTKDSRCLAVKLSIEILPFKLEEPSTYYDIEKNFYTSLYYRGKLKPDFAPYIGSEYKSPAQLKLEYTDMIDHGLNVLPIRNDFLDKKIFAKFMEVYTELIDKKLPERRLMLYAGTSKNLGMFLRKDKKSFEILEERASELRSIGNKCGFQEICTYAIDEAKPQIIKEELPLWREINKQGVGIYVAGIKDVAFQFAANLDILVANGKLSKEAAAEMHKYGHKIFSYSNPQSAPECPKLFRLNYGIKLWLNNYDGAMTYAYQSAFGNVWNDFDGHVQKYRDEVFAYPTSNGLVSTMSWEAYRQAKQDIMYASMLIKLIDKCCRSENKEKLPLALEARNYLENLKLDINSDLDDVRNKIIDFIVELR